MLINFNIKKKIINKKYRYMNIELCFALISVCTAHFNGVFLLRFDFKSDFTTEVNFKLVY